MARRILMLAILPMLIIGLAGTSYAWQGRMAGAGDPYGLLSDESDLLIHPAKIANGEGIKFYSYYRFLYTGVMTWDTEVDSFYPTGVIYALFNRDGSGDEKRHEALLGAATPLGPGRFGIFFTYDGMRGKSNGEQPEYYPPSTPIFYDTYQLSSDLDNFALRLLYGLPLGGFNLGGEVQIAYRDEKNKLLYDEDYGILGRRGLINYFYGGIYSYRTLLFFMLPYDSQYWEALFKGSLEGKVGPLDLEFTLRGGFPFSGDNMYEYKDGFNGVLTGAFDATGGVRGWCIGGDLWLRYTLAGGLTLPFLVRVDYQEKTRDGDGPGQVGLTGIFFDYENQERDFSIEGGGGVDWEPAAGMRVGAGIYYSYLQGENGLQIMESYAGGWDSYDYSDFPASTEHQVIVKLTGEVELSPAVTLRMGLAPFFGWVRENYTHSYNSSVGGAYIEDISTDGYHWGIGGSLGGSLQFDSFTMEPFINGGYQQMNLEGDGTTVATGVLVELFEMNKDRNEWYIGGGCSFLYDMP